MDSRMPMSMSFFWGTDFPLLFSGWVPDTPFLYFLSLLAAFAVSCIHEVIGYARSSVVLRSKAGVPASSSDVLCEVFLHAAYVLTSYILMMMAMCFNAGVFLAIVFGHSLSFGFLRLRDKQRPVVSSV